MKQPRRTAFLPLAMALWSLSTTSHVDSFAVLHQRQQLRHAAATARITSDSPAWESRPSLTMNPQSRKHPRYSHRRSFLTQRFISPQHSQPDAASSPSSNQQHNSNNHRRRRRRSTTSVLHATTKATLEKPSVALKKSKRIQQRSKQPTKSSSSSAEASRSTTDTANTLRRTMMNHEILTREQDNELGMKIKLAQKYQDQLTEMARASLDAQDEAALASSRTTEPPPPKRRGPKVEDPILPNPLTTFRGSSVFEEDEDEEDLWIGGSSIQSIMTPNGRNSNNRIIHHNRPQRLPTEEDEDDFDEMQNLSIYGMEHLQAEPRLNWDDRDSWEEEPDGSMIPTMGDTRTSDLTGSQDQRFAQARQERHVVAEMLETLSDDEIQRLFGLPGGRVELQRILLEGAMARDTLIKHNIRLVVSIAKKWCRQQARGSSYDLTRGSIYRGSSDRPSLDEVIQEGIMGLASAADRFQPSRNLRFSTYATFWVTNMVRKCFQNYSNGMRVPVGYYETRARFRSLVRSYHEEGKPVPSMSELAKELGLSEKKLRTILQVTKSVDSIDAPAVHGSFVAAGKAGGSEQPLDTLSDMLVDEGPSPQEQVELSFLRQSLENAMASELVPYERDIVRLRLGLDDGVSRTVRQISDEYGGALSIFEVRSAEKRAYSKLRSPDTLSTYKLLAYLDFAGIDRDDALFDGI